MPKSLVSACLSAMMLGMAANHASSVYVGFMVSLGVFLGLASVRRMMSEALGR